MNFSKAQRPASLLACAMIAAFAPLAESDADNRIHVYTSQGTVPVDLNKGRLPKNSFQTYYLESALPAKPRPTATPRPKPTPKAKPQPKSKAAPKPEPSPASPIPAQAKAPKTPPAPAKPEITVSKQSPGPGEKRASKPAASTDPVDELDDYATTTAIADPIEPANRGVFWLNHQLYNYIARPISKTYTTILPKPVRTAVHNVYDNIEFPVRFVNHLLQGQPGRADLETRKFLVNSIVGVGGIMKVSDRFPSLAEVPSADTGQTFGKWGVGHGPYVVLPVIGPRSARDTVGFAGDVALNPLTWVPIGGVAQAIALPLTTPNTVRNLDNRLKIYDAATENAVDPYLAIRSAYIQNRNRATAR